MMYKVIKYFTDLHDNGYPYSVGDTYPRQGMTATEERIAELLGSNNKQGQPLIERVPMQEAPTKKSTKKTAK